MSFFEELKRRKVVRVAVVYAATGFVVLQVADILLPNLGVPDWVMRFTVAAVILGFPIALVLAWALEIRPDGTIHRTEATQTDRNAAPALFGKRTLIATALLLAVGVGLSAGWLLKPGAGPQPAETTEVATPTDTDRSIAVLPFVNMSGNADNEYFSDGLTETLLHKLAQVPDLKVAARTSSFAFKDDNSDIREIAQALGVAHVLEGSVQRAGDRVRITAQLIQADDGYHLWSEVFDRDLDDIFAVQDGIAVQVAAALRGSLLSEEVVTEPGGTQNLEAYDLYLRGRAALYDRNVERLNESVRLMRRAIALDPEFALAWAGLSEALAEEAVFEGRMWEVSSEVVANARTAVELAPDSVQTRVRLAWALLRNSFEITEAREHLEHALAIDADDSNALHAMAEVLWSEGRSAEALAYAERAMAEDPLDWQLKVQSVNKFMTMGDIEGAERLARSVVDHDPDYVPGLQALGNVYWRTGRHVEAFRVYHRLLQINPRTVYVMERIAESFLALGHTEGATRWLDRAAEINPDEIRLTRIDVMRLRGEEQRAAAELQRMLEDGRNDPQSSETWIQALENDLAAARGEWARLYELASASLEGLPPDAEDWQVRMYREDLAVAADRLGLHEERDRLMRAFLSEIERGRENGNDHQYIWFWQARALALLGDAAGTANALEQAFERGFRERLELLQEVEFEQVVDAPEMQALLTRIAERNRIDLARMIELERELGDFEASP